MTLIVEVRTGVRHNGRFVVKPVRSVTKVNCLALWERHSGEIFYLHPVNHESMILA
jgi:hypothetical protein